MAGEVISLRAAKDAANADRWVLEKDYESYRPTDCQKLVQLRSESIDIVNVRFRIVAIPSREISATHTVLSFFVR